MKTILREALFLWKKAQMESDALTDVLAKAYTERNDRVAQTKRTTQKGGSAKTA